MKDSTIFVENGTVLKTGTVLIFLVELLLVPKCGGAIFKNGTVLFLRHFLKIVPISTKMVLSLKKVLFYFSTIFVHSTFWCNLGKTEKLGSTNFKSLI